jgi:hypothetical protein
MSGTAGANIGTTGVQPVIGAYVRDALDPTADTNYLGVNTTVAWKTNVLEEDITGPFQSPVNDDAATGSLANWVKAAGTIAAEGRCNIAAGVATANASGTHVCHVIGGVIADDYFWATTFA